MATGERRHISDAFLRQAQQEYLAGDLLQASEKAWGAVSHYVAAMSHYVAAMSEDRCWPTGKHQRTIRNAERLIGESRAPPLFLRLFRSVKMLHINFYEDLLDASDVRIGIQDAALLIEMLKRLDAERNGTLRAGNRGLT